MCSGLRSIPSDMRGLTEPAFRSDHMEMHPLECGECVSKSAGFLTWILHLEKRHAGQLRAEQRKVAGSACLQFTPSVETSDRPCNQSFWRQFPIALLKWIIHFVRSIPINNLQLFRSHVTNHSYNYKDINQTH